LLLWVFGVREQLLLGRYLGDGTGQFEFGLISGDIDVRVEQCGNLPRFDFSWSGQDENDPACGRGQSMKTAS
jgi:hypothetical protein